MATSQSLLLMKIYSFTIAVVCRLYRIYLQEMYNNFVKVIYVKNVLSNDGIVSDATPASPPRHARTLMYKTNGMKDVKCAGVK